LLIFSLIHWPRVSSSVKTPKQVRLEVWNVLEELYRKEKVRSIGVSNFTVKHLSEFFIDSDSSIQVKPMINQVFFIIFIEILFVCED
jgi:diketogulonate reductase-like aldo/keto reductase